MDGMSGNLGGHTTIVNVTTGGMQFGSGGQGNSPRARSASPRRAAGASPRALSGMVTPRSGINSPRSGMVTPRSGTASPQYGTSIDIDFTRVVVPTDMSPADVASWLEVLHSSFIPNKEYYNIALANLRDSVLENGWDGVKFDEALRRKRLYALGVKSVTHDTFMGRRIGEAWVRDFSQ
eukprot:GEMP01092435.1.p1 GENE.GEMP01092435.1~~GEMP01092435.1.p1  ORF type:complete len:203 (+),score=27.30 GEMP01092435.1:75-611(+)